MSQSYCPVKPILQARLNWPTNQPTDPNLAAVLAAIPPGDITSESIPALRKRQNDAATLEITLFLATSLLHTEKRYSLVPRLKATKARPALYHMHSGGMICGNRFAFFKDPLRWAKTAGVVAITVEYPLAPDNHFPAGLNDCYAGLRYVAEHSAELGIDANRLMVSGLSTGANLVAAVAIMARHRNGPRLCGVLLDCGMDDDRGGTVNINQYVKNGIWT